MQLRILATGKPGGDLRVELSEPPDSITLESVTPDGNGLMILLRAEAGKAKAGLKGNLIFNAFSEQTPTSAGGKPQASKRRNPLGTLPAVPFEVIGGEGAESVRLHGLAWSPLPPGEG